MMRILSIALAASSLVAAAPAGAGEVDRAIAACEAAARTKLDAGYERTAASIDHATVTVTLASKAAAGAVTEQCRFSLAGAQWTFDLTASTAGQLCSAYIDAATSKIRVGAPLPTDAADRLRECRDTMHADLDRQARLVIAAASLSLRRQYPIAATATALRAAP